jgi:flagellar basal body-associated protein FliL
MKKSDIAMIILIASISMVVAYFVVKAIPVFQTANTPKQVSTFKEISPNVDEPDPNVFNAEAINPTVEVFIGGGTDQSNPQSGQ